MSEAKALRRSILCTEACPSGQHGTNYFCCLGLPCPSNFTLLKSPDYDATVS